MFHFKHKGDFKKTDNFLKRLLDRQKLYRNLEKFGQRGVDALAAATPRDTGHTADSWGYTVEIDDQKSAIYWTTSNINEGLPIAILIQYGHGTGYGGYVQGVDFINPALKSIFDAIAEDVWKEVTKSE